MIDKIKAVTISPSSNKCDQCKRSLCCRYATQKIAAPRSLRDFDHLLWQVSHHSVHIFKDMEGWFLLIQGDCQHLLADGRCGIYEVRPLVCREHTNDYCEFDDSIENGSELYFHDYTELDDYCRKRFKRWDQRFSQS